MSDASESGGGTKGTACQFPDVDRPGTVAGSWGGNPS